MYDRWGYWPPGSLGGYEHRDIRIGREELPARLGATDIWQASFEQHDIRLCPLRQLSKPLGRSALGYYLEVRVVPQDRLEALAGDFMIIDNHDPHRASP